MEGMLEKVREALRRYRMVAAGEKVLVAVSGGADSMALLYALFRLRQEFQLDLAVAHLDHGIRADTEEDLKVVRGAAEDLGLPLFFARVDALSYAKRERLNLEEAARRLRREFLLRTAQEVQAQKIALGHTRTDLAETVLLHLFRGAGPAGLKGLLPAAFPFIRPLILCSREETRAFCAAHALPFRDDPTNLDRRFLRNALRLELLPVLKKYNPRAEEALARAAELLAETEAVLIWTEEKILAECGRGGGLDLPRLRELPQPVQALAVRALARRYGLILYRRHVEAILRGVARGQAAEFRLPQGLLAHIGRGLLKIEEAKPVPKGTWLLSGETIVPELGWAFALGRVPRPERLDSGDPSLIYVSAAKIAPPLSVRAATKADTFRPFGRKGEKRVWDVLSRRGIPRWERERWPVVVDERSVVWVVGVRPSGDHSVEEGEEEVLYLRAWRL